MAENNDLTQLRRTLYDCFSVEELRTLCFDLGIDYDGLPGEGKEAKARELLAYFKRRKRTAELVEAIEQHLGDKRRRRVHRPISAALEIVGIFLLVGVLIYGGYWLIRLIQGPGSDPHTATPTAPAILPADATPTDPTTAIDYLEQVFLMWTLSGDLREDSEGDRYVLSAFHSILTLSGDDSPEDTMWGWIEVAKEEAARAIGGSVSDYAFLEFGLSGPFESITLEESYRRLWEHVLAEPDSDTKVSNMAAIRLSLIAAVGEDRQQELIGAWNEESR